MPTRKEIQWSQLRVGALVVVAIGVFIALIFLMSGASGGLFAKKLTIRAYFPNASGLKNGAPVTLQGVTIGNVQRMNVVTGHNPDPVEVIMQIGSASAGGIHTDSTATIAQAGVLGDSYVDIDSTRATGPTPPPNGSVLKASGAPTVQDVIRSSAETIDQIQSLMKKLDTLAATLNSKDGLVGELVNDPVLARKVLAIATNLETVTNAINQGQGTLGKLVTDDSIYTRASSAVDKLDQIATALQNGQGTAGKLLKDEALYNNLNSAVSNTNQLVAGINNGQGALGKVAKDPEFARKLDNTISSLDEILKKINAGQGTLGQLVENRALYDHTDQTMTQAQQLLQAFRENPKKYLQIHLRIF